MHSLTVKHKLVFVSTSAVQFQSRVSLSFASTSNANECTLFHCSTSTYLSYFLKNFFLFVDTHGTLCKKCFICECEHVQITKFCCVLIS